MTRSALRILRKTRTCASGSGSVIRASAAQRGSRDASENFLHREPESEKLAIAPRKSDHLDSDRKSRGRERGRQREAREARAARKRGIARHDVAKRHALAADLDLRVVAKRQRRS